MRVQSIACLVGRLTGYSFKIGLIMLVSHCLEERDLIDSE